MVRPERKLRGGKLLTLVKGSGYLSGKRKRPVVLEEDYEEAIFRNPSIKEGAALFFERFRVDAKEVPQLTLVAGLQLLRKYQQRGATEVDAIIVA